MVEERLTIRLATRSSTRPRATPAPPKILRSICNYSSWSTSTYSFGRLRIACSPLSQTTVLQRPAGRPGNGGLPSPAKVIDCGATASMNKRTFLELLSAALAGSGIQRLFAWASDRRLTNWAGNFEFSTERLYEANSVEQVRKIVKAHKKLKVLGTRHCFNRIADSPDALLSLRSMDETVSLDPKARAVTVHAGMKYGRLCPYLDGKGFALHNLASLPHISIAGSCSTGTHGSGEKNGNLSTAVTALEIVPAPGDVMKLSRPKDGETFRGAVVGLGALGVITGVTLDVQPAFVM